MKVRVASKMRQSVNEVIKETTTKMEKQSNDETPTHTKQPKTKTNQHIPNQISQISQTKHPPNHLSVKKPPANAPYTISLHGTF